MLGRQYVWFVPVFPREPSCGAEQVGQLKLELRNASGLRWGRGSICNQFGQALKDKISVIFTWHGQWGVDTKPCTSGYVYEERGIVFPSFSQMLLASHQICFPTLLRSCSLISHGHCAAYVAFWANTHWGSHVKDMGNPTSSRLQPHPKYKQSYG